MLRIFLAAELFSTGFAQQNIEEFKKKAEAGGIVAQRKLGFTYLKGLGVTIDVAEGVKWYRKAAESGDATAQYVLGKLYEKGEGVP